MDIGKEGEPFWVEPAEDPFAEPSAEPEWEGPPVPDREEVEA